MSDIEEEDHMSQHNDDREEDDEELITIEENSQKLENLYREMEQIRRENMLFEAYIWRTNPDALKEDDEQDRKLRGKNKKDKLEKKQLTPQEKFDIATFESEALKKNIDEGRIKSDTILETLRAVLEQTDMEITEIRKDAFDFQREILIGGENSRTGKIEAERIIRYREEKLRQKDSLIEKYKAKKATLESQIIKTDNQIKKKEEIGDDLKFIDFHQLQIENKKYVKEIDEKNKKLSDLKSSTGQIVTKLTNERKRLLDAITDGRNYKEQIIIKEKNIAKICDEIIKVKKEIEAETVQNKKLLLQKEQIRNIPHIMDYVDQKLSEQNFKYEISNLERKIQIAELQYKTAVKFLRSKGVQVAPPE